MGVAFGQTREISNHKIIKWMTDSCFIPPTSLIGVISYLLPVKLMLLPFKGTALVQMHKTMLVSRLQHNSHPRNCIFSLIKSSLPDFAFIQSTWMKGQPKKPARLQSCALHRDTMRRNLKKSAISVPKGNSSLIESIAFWWMLYNGRY